MKHQSKFSQNQEHTEEQQTHAQSGKEFADSDELLRYDAAQTVVPSEVAQRLQKSAAEVRPPESRPWWKSIFSK